ncbi:MAG: class I SAM-dependent methyltransferase [bacterium]|nr:class I SAM-dependent methyltransferase [Gammaproteobacteria bacterium]HIL96495.1 class I SAM-dependent methyltransferase [Pseudomonadales bacterium]
MARVDEIALYFNGHELIGDTFSHDEIEQWFEQEVEGYFGLYGNAEERKAYGNHALNAHYLFKHLPDGDFPVVMGLGSGNGDEFEPIAARCGKITIVDPSDGHSDTVRWGVDIAYEKAVNSGVLGFEDDTFDLIVCFSCLHHIPNVSFVVSELFRVLKPGGTILIREPIISMGDWRAPRLGLTRNERGLPLLLFQNMMDRAGFTTRSLKVCSFPLLERLKPFFTGGVYNNRAVVLLDDLLSRLTLVNYRYHATSVWHKFRPVAVSIVAMKSAAKKG